MSHDLIATPPGTLFDLEPQTLATLIVPDDPAQVTVFDAIAEVEAEQAEFDAVAYFERIWRGEAQGFSEAKIRDQLADYERSLANLNSRNAKSIVGPHVASPVKAAREWLNKQIGDAERDLAARGRTNSVNIANVTHHAPAGHPLKDHRIRFVGSKYDSQAYATLWGAACACGWRECGFTKVIDADYTWKPVAEHLAGVNA